MLVGTGLAACAPQDRVVGSVSEAGSDASGVHTDAGAQEQLLISTDFATDDGIWDRQRLVPGAAVDFGVADPLARDGEEVALVLPGMPGLGAADRAGPDLATQISTKQFVRYGTLRTRVRFATCQPGEEAVNAAFAFFNDGTDTNANGLADNPEIDFQVLCGRPSFIVLTVWKDFEKASDGTEHFYKSSRAVDTSSGDLYDLASPSDYPYARTGEDGRLALSGFPDPNVFYEIGFEWQHDSVRFFVVSGGTELTLWKMVDRAYVPVVPLQIMYNVWHSPTHWVPDRASASYPAADATLRVDWLEYRAP